MKKLIFVSVLMVATLLGLIVTPVSADPEEKITICHAAGQDNTTQFVTLTLSRNAVYQDQGNGGHFYENGTPKSGHEQDYFGDCRTPSSPTPSPSASPLPSPSSSPSVSPSSSPSPSSSSSSSSSSSTNDSSSSSSSSNNQEGQVLGAYAGTGVVEDVIMNALGSVGGLMTMAGSVLYGQKKTKKRSL